MIGSIIWYAEILRGESMSDSGGWIRRKRRFHLFDYEYYPNIIADDMPVERHVHTLITRRSSVVAHFLRAVNLLDK